MEQPNQCQAASGFFSNGAMTLVYNVCTLLHCLCATCGVSVCRFGRAVTAPEINSHRVIAWPCDAEDCQVE
jgi:hypothetical protein